MDTTPGSRCARLQLLCPPERALPNPAVARAHQLAAALAHRQQRLAHRRAAADDERAAPRAAHTAPVPPNTRSLRSRTRKDARPRARAEPPTPSQPPSQLLSPPHSPPPPPPQQQQQQQQSSPTAAGGSDVFGYVEDEELRVALDDALACITDPAARGPREVLADAAGALARMRLVHAAVLLRFAVRLNVGTPRTRDEDAENYETFAHLRTLLSCADARVVAGVLDRLAQDAAREAADAPLKTEETKEKEMEEKENEEEDPEWARLPAIAVEDADEFVPLLGTAGPVGADTPSLLRVETLGSSSGSSGGTRTVATAAAEPGTVLHVLRGVVLRGERYGAGLFTRGAGRHAGTYTVGCDDAQTARVRTRDDAVLAATRRACTCNASLYLVPCAAPAAAGARVLAIVADAPVRPGDEVTLPHEMLWETCLEAPPCSCAAATAAAAAAAAAAASSETSMDDTGSTSSSSSTSGCALAEFFEQRERLFETVRRCGAASLLGERPAESGAGTGSRARSSRSRVRSSSSSSRRRKQQQRRRALSPPAPSAPESRPALSREDRKLQAIFESIKKLEERPPASRRRQRDADTPDDTASA